MSFLSSTGLSAAGLPCSRGTGTRTVAFSRVRNPDLYHGTGKKSPFFEGWYFKLVDAAERHSYAVIPGVFIGSDADPSHAFIQTLDGMTGRSTYHRYPLEAFSADAGAMDIRVGPNRFTRDHMSLELTSPERSMSGVVRFRNLSPWPVTLASPGIMGWYAYVPFMECYHGVVSLDHAIEGALTVDGEQLEFTGGRGYIEKDWGQGFPDAWVWMQANHFEQPGTSITASVATIPWLGGSFLGFIAGFWHERRLHRFATYTGAKLGLLDASEDAVRIHLVARPDRRADRPGLRLELTAARAGGGMLRSPERIAMLQRVEESLTASVHARLVALEQGRERTLFDGTGRNAGLEVVGDLVSSSGRA